jgi:hypothetical protein
VLPKDGSSRDASTQRHLQVSDCRNSVACDACL